MVPSWLPRMEQDERARLTTFRNFWACILVKSPESRHISQASIEIHRQMWGEHSPQFRQKHLAEFTAEDKESFISAASVLKRAQLIGTLGGRKELDPEAGNSGAS